MAETSTPSHRITAPSRAPRRRLRVFFVAAVAVALALLPGTALASTNVTVSKGVCSVAFSAPAGTWGSGLNLQFGRHSAMNVKLVASASWGWKYGVRGPIAGPTGKIYNHFSVRFLDQSGKQVWSEYNSIPNGKSRTYYVGSNVKTIQIQTDPYAYGWVTQPTVSYVS